jgi:hypothetical protein
MKDIIRLPFFYLKHNVSETGFCLCLNFVSTELGPVDKISLCLRQGDSIRMCFLWGTDKPLEFSWVLNKRQDDG